MDFGHVEGDRSLVVHRGIRGHSDSRTSSNGNSCCVATSARSPYIATEIIRFEVRDRRIVVGVRADILVLPTFLTVCSKVLPDVCNTIST